VTNPYRASRDSIGGGFDMGTASDIADGHLDSFRSSAGTPPDRLGEHDYRGGAGSAPSDVGTEDVTPQRQGRQEPTRFTYPSVSREPKAT
jgi:hypothetical protein